METNQNCITTATFLGVISFVIFTCYAFIFSNDITLLYKSRHWPKTVGVIKEAQVIKHPKARQSQEDTFTLKLEYTYTVAANTHCAHRMHFVKEEIYHQHDLQDLAKAYLPGKPIEVYFNPVRNSESVLFPGRFSEAAQIILLVMAACLITSTISMVLLIKHWKNQ